jgi:hypothetical protein
MKLPPSKVEEIVQSGANLSINGGREKPETTERIVAAAVQSGSEVTVRHADALPPETLLKLAKIGGDQITLELD